MTHARRGEVLAVLVLHGAGVTVLPLLHHAVHHLPHVHSAFDEPHAHAPSPQRAPAALTGHGPGHRRHTHARSAVHPPAPRRSPEPDRRPAPPSRPEHGRNAPEHFGVAAGPAETAEPVLVLALAPPSRPHHDSTVFEPAFQPTAARPRAPPHA